MNIYELEKNLLHKELSKPFNENEIEWRVGQCGRTQGGGFWAKVLAYISARAIQDRLDTVVGPANWKCRYEHIGDKGVICYLSIRCNGEWVEKSDGAESTDIEPFKGGLSSALKRAGSAWGMGRYLYDLEEAFATITDKNDKNAKYAKTKENDVFYWSPPELPDWALPAKPKPNNTNISSPDSRPVQKQSAQSTNIPTVEVSDAQLKRLWAMSKTLKWSVEDTITKVKQDFKKDHPQNLSREEYTLMTSRMQVEIDRIKPLNA